MWWFNNRKKPTPRRRFDEDDDLPRQLLMVNARVSDQKRVRSYRVGVVVFGLILMAGLGGALWFLVLQAGAMLFTENARYTLKVLDIRSDGRTITPDLVREWTGLRTGLNLFSLQISQIRSDLLHKVPMLKSVDIIRRLPDRLDIEISERRPVAKLGATGQLTVDKDGYVFSPRSASEILPAITGYRGPTPYPGTNIRGTVLRALEVLDLCARTPIGQSIRISGIDVGNDDYLLLYLAGGECARLAWQGATPTASSRPDLDRKLRTLIRTLQKSAERGKHIAWVDLTFNEDYIPAQEY